VRIPYLTVVAVYCAIIYWLSTAHIEVAEPLQFSHYDKLGHAVVFGGLAFLVAAGMWRSGRRYSNAGLYWAPVIFASGYGLFIELVQLFLPHRSFDPWDIVANTAGALLVMSVLAELVRRFGPRFKVEPD